MLNFYAFCNSEIANDVPDQSSRLISDTLRFLHSFASIGPKSWWWWCVCLEEEGRGGVLMCVYFLPSPLSFHHLNRINVSQPDYKQHIKENTYLDGGRPSSNRTSSSMLFKIPSLITTNTITISRIKLTVLFLGKT